MSEASVYFCIEICAWGLGMPRVACAQFRRFAAMRTNPLHRCRKSVFAPLLSHIISIAVSILLCYKSQWTKQTMESFLWKIHENQMKILWKLLNNESFWRCAKRAPGQGPGPKIGTGPGPGSGPCANFWARARARGPLAHCRGDSWATLQVSSFFVSIFPWWPWEYKTTDRK